MNKIIDTLSYGLAGMGVSACIGAMLARLTGNHVVMNYQSITILATGVTLVVLACFLKLHVISEALTVDN